MLRALVTGGPGRSCAVVAALERSGFSVTAEHRAPDSPWGPVPLPSGPLQCYAQLPWLPHPGGGDAFPMLDCLAARLDLLAAVAPRLGPEAAVVLAVEDADPRRPEANADLLSALALVILEDSGRPEARVMTVPAAELCASSEARPALVDGPILHGLGRTRPEAVPARG